MSRSGPFITATEERLDAALRGAAARTEAAEKENERLRECLEFLLREAINGVVCDPVEACVRCDENWQRVYALLDHEQAVTKGKNVDDR